MVMYVKNPETISFLRRISTIVLICSIVLIAVGVYWVSSGHELILLILGLVFFPISLISLIGTTRMRVGRNEKT